MLIVNKSFKNFIDRVYDTDKISNLLRFIIAHEGHGLTDVSEINHLSFGKKGMIDYALTHKDLDISPMGEWLPKNRQSGKPSKIIRKILNKDVLKLLTEKDFENFANIYKSKGLNVNYEFQIVNGIEIHNTYNMMCTKESGSLGSSCMRKNYKMFGLYVGNPDVVSLIRLIDKQTNKLAGRALLWNLPNGKRLMDRIYSDQDFLVDLFMDFAKEEEIDYCKKEQNHSSYTKWFNLKTESLEEVKMEIELDTNYNLSPYLDTFHYGKDGVISNYPLAGQTYTYSSSSGGRGDSEGDIKRPSYGESLVLVTFGDFYNQLHDSSDVIEIDGYIYHKDDSNLVTTYNKEIHRKNDCVFCVDINEYVYYSETTYYCETDGNRYFSNENLIESQGEYFNIDDPNVVEIDGKFYHRDDSSIEFNEETNKYELK